MKRNWSMPSFHAAGYWPADLIMNGMGHGKGRWKIPYP